METLPDDIIEYLLGYITPFTLYKLSLVNKKYKKLTESKMNLVKIVFTRMLNNLSNYNFNFQDLFGFYRRGKSISIKRLSNSKYYQDKFIQFIYYYNDNNFFSKRIDIVDGYFKGLRYVEDKYILDLKMVNRYTAFKWHNSETMPTENWEFRKNDLECNNNWYVSFILPKSIRIIY